MRYILNLPGPRPRLGKWDPKATVSEQVGDTAGLCRGRSRGGFSPRNRFGVRHERRNDGALLLLSGELDLATAPALEEQMAFVEADAAEGVVPGVRDLTLVDSLGLHVFDGARKRASANRHRFAVVAATSAVHVLFKLAGIDAIFWETDRLRLLEEFEGGVGFPARLRGREISDG